MGRLDNITEAIYGASSPGEGWPDVIRLRTDVRLEVMEELGPFYPYSSSPRRVFPTSILGVKVGPDLPPGPVLYELFRGNKPDNLRGS
jgi:hypothetical protein